MQRNTLVIALALAATTAAALPLLAGCGGGGGGSAPCNANAVDALCGADPTTTSVSKTTPEGLTATLAESSYTTTASTGQVLFTMTLTNTTASAVDVVTFPDGTGQPVAPAGLSTIDNGGSTVYTYPSDGTPPTPVEKILQPGESLVTSVPQGAGFAPSHKGRFQTTAVFSFNGHNTSVGPLTVSAH